MGLDNVIVKSVELQNAVVADKELGRLSAITSAVHASSDKIRGTIADHHHLSEGVNNFPIDRSVMNHGNTNGHGNVPNMRGPSGRGSPA